jgi:hypothetical protein
MIPHRRAQPLARIALIGLCCLVGTAVRVAIVSEWGVWTADGRLAIDPLLYAASMGIDLFVALAMYTVLTEGRDNDNGHGNGG